MIEIVQYRERWPEEFAEIAATLRDALGDLALRIDHIGSTSVPGLPAKDVIDVQVTVATLDAEIERALGTVGYTRRADITGDHRPPGVSGPASDWEKQYYAAPQGQRRTHLHARVAGRPNQRYPLLFRDYLRAQPEATKGYAELKRQLARYHSDDIVAYVEIKDPACDIIMAAAEDWARATGWQPGPSGA
jgi:GrpB-like predicted nucleotidyltransferase (UPF0157 family)